MGKLTELTDRDELYTTLLNPYTQALMSAVPVREPTVEEQRERIIVTGNLPSRSTPPRRRHFNIRILFN